MSLLFGLIWSFHLQYGQPPSFYLKAPTLLYVFIFIALRALRFAPTYVLAAGLTAALGKLIDQWLGYFRSCGGDQYCAKRSEFVPAICSIKAFDRRVENANLVDDLLGIARKLGDSLQSEDPSCDLSENRRLVA